MNVRHPTPPEHTDSTRLNATQAPKSRETVCAYCGIAFTPRRAHGKYHTDACRAAAYRAGGPLDPVETRRRLDDLERRLAALEARNG